MKKLLGVLVAVALLLLPRELPPFMAYSATPLAAQGLRPALPTLEPPFARVHRGTVERNATLQSLLGEVMRPEAMHRMVEAARPLHNLARLSVGHPFALTLGPDGILTAFSYGIDELRLLRVRRQGDSFTAQVVTRDHEVRTETVAGVIRSSLFAAVEEAGEKDQFALDLAAIYEYDVDFNTELQPGDAFRVALDKVYVEGRFSHYGQVLAAEFQRGDRLIRAVRFEAARGPEYYTPEGVPLRKTFLRSPLKFSRISSRFTRSRFHPVLKRSRPHLGVDYAAPVGTPVRAAADGVVTLAGWHGGYGKTVRLRHGRGLETLYGHLSRIHVRGGQRVVQGDLIGAVGSTGLSTGPHLDYRTMKNGVFVNPLTIQPPPPEPVPAALRAAFDAARDRQLALLGVAGPVLVQAEARTGDGL
ncbi:MAG TPA: M23 family metallopeptidase [Vicinamibacteria bacterium]|jgi:murein DD-endopeptidase MepM/ murein hydrolase activator NlpD